MYQSFFFYAYSRGTANYFFLDYKFPGIDWTTLTARNTVERQYVDIVNDSGLKHLIDSFQLLRTDLLLLCQLVNACIDSSLNAIFVCSTSRTHQFDNFKFQKTKNLRPMNTF